MNEAKKHKSDVAKREEEILSFWQKYDIFKKTEEKDSPNGEFVFYDGPPFATGLPHYGHILAGTIKDAIPRYKVMRGFKVRRKWGWDCHGLPLENEVEKELGLKTKKDIEELGVDVFNKKARDSVLRYADDWKKIVPRLGRWVDMERDYKTMDTSYMESAWWVFKTLFDKKLIYEGFKSMHLCPRCETTLSNFEVAEGYKDIKDFAVTVKLELEDPIGTNGRHSTIKSNTVAFNSNGASEPKTYLLAWTTTAWTLPGNMASAVNKNATYGKFQISNSKFPNEYFIVVKERAKDVFDGMEYKLIEEFKGKELIGKKYKPLFDYYKNADLKGKENAWKVYHASYVSTEDGTGIVHLAPAFGEEDMELAQKEGIPLVHHVGTDGKFKKEVTDFAGLSVKPKDDPSNPSGQGHQSTDIEIIKNLAHRGLLFNKEKITHSYPHCWRCDTPLLNYASSSWFVKVADIKKKLISENQKVKWVPNDLKDGRFGKWLEGARDWAISRARYWGTPLPVWKNKDTGEVIAIGSIDDLKQNIKKSGNKYFIIRHGESESNSKGVISSRAENPHPLTEKGRDEALEAALKLKKENIDLIITSPFVRTKETAKIVADGIDIQSESMIEDARIGEINLGDLNNKSIANYFVFAPTYHKRFISAPPNGETLMDVKRRVGEFLYEIEKKYSNKNILFVTHEYSAWMLTAVSVGANEEQSILLKEKYEDHGDFIKNAEVRELVFIPLPHNKDFDLDLHRPYIDFVQLRDELERIPDVFDCWFESGSMPYGQFHYPFENLERLNPKKNIGFPADFIAEGLDQTRGWFYSLMVLGVALFGKSPYKNVVVNGLVLAEDGRKMSKRLKNYPEPMDVVDLYGADSLRYYLLSSPVVRGEDLIFKEEVVAEVMRKIIMRLSNVHSFYALYASELQATSYKPQANHVLDQWIVARLNELIKETTEAMENYELDRAVRPIGVFIEDISIWYIRRSRDRFKGDDANDKEQALQTTQFVLRELSKVMAPFMPFFADWLYKKVGGEQKSVHLDEWPEVESRIKNHESRILNDMNEVREIVSMALEAREYLEFKVRQPLASLTIKTKNKKLKNNEQLLQLIKDEINVKEVVCSDDIQGEILLDPNITPELKEEGMARDFIRHIQGLRKKEKLTTNDFVALSIDTNEKGKAFIQKFEDEIKKTAQLSEIKFTNVEGEKIEIDNLAFTFSIQK